MSYLLRRNNNVQICKQSKWYAKTQVFGSVLMQLCSGATHHHWLDSPVWALAFYKTFLHTSLFNVKFFQFLSPKSLISWSTPPPNLNLGRYRDSTFHDPMFSLLSLRRKVRLMISPVCLSVCVSP
jgi:hypothetical protein